MEDSPPGEIKFIELKTYMDLYSIRQSSSAPIESPSAEVSLLYERLRMGISVGVTSYSINPDRKSILLSSLNKLSICKVSQIKDSNSFLYVSSVSLFIFVSELSLF